MQIRKITAILFLLILQTISAQAQDLKTAIKLTESEQYEAASNMFNTLLQKESKNGDILFYLGENYFKSDNDSARVIYEKGIQVAPANGLNYVGLGKIALNNGDVTGANAQFNKALQLSANKDVRVLTAIAEAWINAPKPDVQKALALLQTAEKLDYRNPYIQILTGDAFLIDNNGSQAITHYERAQEFDSKSPLAKLRIGQLWVRARNYNEALLFYKQAIEIDPNFAPAHRELGELYAMAKRYDEARESYKKYLDLSSKNTHAKVRYASFLYMTKDYEESLKNIEEVMALDTSFNILNRLSAYSYYELNEAEKGLPYIEKYLATAKPNKIIPMDYAYYGKILSRMGNDSLALEKLKMAVQLDTANLELLTDMAMINTKMKRYNEAIALYEQKVSVNKAMAADYFRLGQNYYLTQVYSKADSALASATALLPNWPVGYLWRGRASTGLDPDSKQGLAKPHYELFIEKATPEATKYTKDLVEAYEYLGYYYLLNKDYANARTYWEKTKELDPKNAKAIRALEELKAK